ncbi:restriction endonuclease subunit S [Mycoplasma sp. VS276A1]
MNKNELKPSIRFKGFTDAWEKQTLDKITDISIGEFINAKYQNDKYPYPVYNGGISNTGYYQFQNREKDEIIISARGSAGYVNYINVPYWAGNSCYSIKNKENNSNNNKFLYYALKLLENNLMSNQQSANIPAISKKTISNININICSIKEQLVLSFFFDNIESLITFYKRKSEKLENLKKSLLEKMFVSDGEQFPAIRFKGFTNTWEKNKLDKFLFIPREIKRNVESMNELITVGLNLTGLRCGSNKSKLSFGSTNYYQRFTGQLIYGKQNLFHGSLALITPKYNGKCTSKDVPSFDIDNIDKNFIYQFMARPVFYENTEQYAMGTGSKRIHEDILLSLEIISPKDITEQNKIAKLIINLNDLSAFYKRKCDKLENIKKSLLEKMFC